MEKKPKLYVLGVAINNYAVPAHKLNGCHNDLNDLVEYLSENINREQWELKICPLKDKAATRAAVIHQFRTFFQPLEDGDTAIFYFSGHGSQALMPEVPQQRLDRMHHETIVCYDSRTDSRDLYDKELSYLIWTITKDKNIHFTVILDCCHSGSGTRGEQEKDLEVKEGVRMLEDCKAKEGWSRDLGIAAEYDKGNNEIPVGKHILIAACRRNEEAKERMLNGKKRGVLTFGLVNALKKSKGNITYGALEDEIRAVVYNFVADQSPVLEGHSIDQVRQLFFLNGAIKKEDNRFLISWHPAKGWVFYQGQINGIVENELGKNRVEIIPQDLAGEVVVAKDLEKIEIDTIYATHCTLKMPTHLTTDTSKRFLGKLAKCKIDPLKIAIAANSNAKEVALFLKEWKLDGLDFLERSTLADAQYIIELDEKGSTIFPVGAKKMRFRDLHRGVGRHFFSLFEKLESIANWHQIKKMKSIDSRIAKDDLQFTFYRIKQNSGRSLKEIEEEAIADFLSTTVKLSYEYHADTASWKSPVFKLKIENRSTTQQCFWVAVLFLGTNFQITNELCRIKMIQAGETEWLELLDRDTGKYTKAISLSIGEAYQKLGITKLTEHFKILIATDEFSSYPFNQNELPLLPEDQPTNPKNYRNATSKTPAIIDWKVLDFSVEITKEK
ncbi:MAG: caspase family protein [Saprospiraceae bacterium]